MADKTRGPAWTATRENPFVVMHDGKTFRLFVEAGGGAMVSEGQVARLTHPAWTVEVGGVRRMGWPPTPDGSETEDALRNRLVQWWEDNRG